MSRKDRIEDTAFELLSGVCESLGLIPVDAEYTRNGGEYALMLYVDKEGGVGINDCEAASRAIDPLLDEADVIPDAYTLYVSSPGLGRTIRRPRDFIFARGKEVELHTFKAIDGSKEFRGILKDFDDHTVTIESDGAERCFERSVISRLALAFDL